MVGIRNVIAHVLGKEICVAIMFLNVSDVF